MSKVFFLGYGDILLDRCDNCGGFWLDAGELDLINDRLKEALHAKTPGLFHFVKDVHSPYWQKRIRRKSSETDFKVDVSPLKDGTFKAQAAHRCPACAANLNIYEAYGIEIEGCPNCKGLWLDKDELRRLKDKSEKGAWFGLRWMDDEIERTENARSMSSKRLCPKCPEAGLISTIFGHSAVIIDWCPGCHGTWLDRNEFEAIVDSLKAKLLTLSADEMKGRVYQEIREIWSGPENVISEILDAKAAISALINITIFEHPELTIELLKRFPPGHTVPRPW
jgi:Zn-finger nucleic acid-binding protein